MGQCCGACQKKDEGLRFCINPCKLNNRTIKDGYSLPRIEDTLDCLHGAVWFSTLDLKSRYWQVELEEEAKPLTAFTMGPLGFWECECMPFGLTNAPATFQRLMESCLGELHLNWCIIVFSQTPEEHLHRLQAVFNKLRAAGLKLKPSKCDLVPFSLTRSERNYPVHKLEFLALKWAITDKFYEYLYGSEFQVYTDNNLLTYVLTMAKLDATGHRWVAALSNYTFSIIYKPGKGHHDADALSCSMWPEAMELNSQTVQAVCKGVQAPRGKIETLCHGAQVVDALAQDNAPPGMTPLEWCHAQAKDPVISQIIGEIQKKTIGKLEIKMEMPSEMKALIRIKKQLILKQGVLYRRTSQVNTRTKFQLVLPNSHRTRAVAGCHDQVGHLGQDRVLDLLRDWFYWPGIHTDVVSYINSCPRCLRRKSQPDKAPFLNIEASQPLELIHLDYLKIDPSKGNIENVLVITDHFTRCAHAFPSKTQTALATVKLLWNNFILHYGLPSKIITDQGRNFESELIENLCQLAGLQKPRTSPHHPQTNGQCERFNGTLLNMLGSLTQEQKKDWKSHVPALVHMYNCTRNAATGFTPYYLLFGREPRLPVDVEFGLQRGSQKGSPGESSYVSTAEKETLVCPQEGQAHGQEAIG